MLNFKSRFPYNLQGKPRIFFFCHPDETDQYLDPVSDAVLSAYDCVVYYPSSSLLDLDLEADILNMQLIIVPITLQFFRGDNAAAHDICAFACANHIPFLPIIVDDIAGDEFSRRWGSYSTLSMPDILSTDHNHEQVKNILISHLETKVPEGSWIFLSHSSADINKVRNIRNRFEGNGHNPLAFHLKCLRTDTDEGRKELLSLIKREIDARDWFVFCDSDAANESEYVSMEREHVINTGKKKIWTLNMQLSEDDLMASVDLICQKVSVYISYRKKDRSITRVLQQALAAKDFDVWFDDFLTPGFAFSDTIAHKIHDCNYFIALITDGYDESYCGKYELPFAIHSDKRVIPILVGDVPVPYYLQTVHCYRLPRLPHLEDIQAIAEFVEADLRSTIQGPVSQDDAFDTIDHFHKRYT